MIHYYNKLPLELTTDCAEMESNYRDGNCEDTVEKCHTVFVDLQETQNRLHNSNSDILCFFCEVSWTQEPHMDLCFLTSKHEVQSAAWFFSVHKTITQNKQILIV